MKKLLGTTAAALALGVGAVVMNTGAASADVLPTLENTRCHGTQVVTCTFLQFDGGTVTARGSITDTANDGHPFTVKVEYVRLEEKLTGGDWHGVRWMNDTNEGDANGFFDNYDVADTNSFTCGGGHIGTRYRAVAKFTWKDAAGNTDVQWQEGVATPCSGS